MAISVSYRFSEGALYIHVSCMDNGLEDVIIYFVWVQLSNYEVDAGSYHSLFGTASILTILGIDYERYLAYYSLN